MTFEFTVRDKHGKAVNGCAEIEMIDVTTFSGPKREVIGLAGYGLSFKLQEDVVNAIRGVLPSLEAHEVVAQLREPILRMADAVAKR